MNLVLFTSETCAYCPMMKRWLESKGLSFIEKSIKEQENAELVYKLTGYNIAPTLLIEDGDKQDVVMGLNIGKLNSLLGSLTASA